MKKTHWWIMGGFTLTALGIGSYFLFFHQESQTSTKSAKSTKRNDKRTNNQSRKTASGVNASDKGVQTTKAEQGVRINIPNWDNPFDINYLEEVKAWLSPQRIYELNPKDAAQLAKQLHDAYGGAWYINDDEEAIKVVFAQMLKDKVQVAGLSKAFWNKYQKDLWEYLAQFLSPRELEEYVHRPVNELPNYRIVK